eukprot:m.1448207 g.1448207  ORF g.1448207 m.1448207 type:complete len:360 (-) comp25112_c0_seq3:3116-4195(-)
MKFTKHYFACMLPFQISMEGFPAFPPSCRGQHGAGSENVYVLDAAQSIFCVATAHGLRTCLATTTSTSGGLRQRCIATTHLVMLDRASVRTAAFSKQAIYGGRVLQPQTRCIGTFRTFRPRPHCARAQGHLAASFGSLRSQDSVGYTAEDVCGMARETPNAHTCASIRGRGLVSLQHAGAAHVHAAVGPPAGMRAKRNQVDCRRGCFSQQPIASICVLLVEAYDEDQGIRSIQNEYRALALERTPAATCPETLAGALPRCTQAQGTCAASAARPSPPVAVRRVSPLAVRCRAGRILCRKYIAGSAAARATICNAVATKDCNASPATASPTQASNGRSKRPCRGELCAAPVPPTTDWDTR